MSKSSGAIYLVLLGTASAAFLGYKATTGRAPPSSGVESTNFFADGGSSFEPDSEQNGGLSELPTTNPTTGPFAPGSGNASGSGSRSGSSQYHHYYGSGYVGGYSHSSVGGGESHSSGSSSAGHSSGTSRGGFGGSGHAAGS